MSESLTVRSMADALTEDKHKNGSKGKIYKALSDEHKNEEISLSIRNKATALKEAINAPKVNLADTEQVKERAFMYLEACGVSCSFPSVMGLSGAMQNERKDAYSEFDRLGSLYNAAVIAREKSRFDQEFNRLSAIVSAVFRKMIADFTAERHKKVTAMVRTAPTESMRNLLETLKMDCLNNEPLKWKALIMFAIDSGCRRGEIVGLRWEEIDFKTGKVNICRNAQYTAGKGTYISTTKNRKNRVIYLNRPVLTVLAEWKRQQALLHFGQGIPLNGFCFTQDNGKMMNPQAPTSYLTRFGKKYNLPGIHPHALRHTMLIMVIHLVQM